MRNSILAICLGLGIVIAPVKIALSVSVTVQKEIDRGREAMIQGDYATAIASWEQAKQGLTSRRNTETVDLETAILIDNFLSLGYQEIGDLEKAETAIASATKLLEKQELNRDLVAKVHNTQANLNLKQDNPQAAALNFRAAKELYIKNKDPEGEVGAAINEAIAFQQLGQYRTAQKILEKAELKLTSLPKNLQAAGYKALGTTYATIGDFKAAKEKLEASIALTQDKDLEATAKTKIDLAAAIGFSEPETAIKLLQKVGSSSQNGETKAIALLNSIKIYIEAEDWTKAKEIALNSQDLILNLPHHDFAKIDLIEKMALIESHLVSVSSVPPHQSWLSSLKLLASKPDTLINQSHKQLLEQIAQSAQSKGIVRTESYAMGTLAYLEEQQGNLTKAIALNQYALDLAEKIVAEDIAYQWQWQLGRIFKTQGETTRAIASYEQAVNNLGQIREDLVAFNPESQYSFRESVEPVYRQLVELLISQPTQDNLIQARDTIESLQMAELENYFRQACLQATPEKIDNIDPAAATIYPIVTPEKLAVLTSIPGQSIKLHTQDINSDEIESQIKELVGQFNPAASNKRRKANSQKFYSWLVEPSLKDFQTAKIETLVFVLDSSLRNLPVSALYDGEQYLIENYAIALTPGLQLLPSSTLENKKLEAVVAGLSEANQGFVALPGVKTEVQEIAANIDSKLLLDQEFTNDRLRQTLKATTEAPILHLATHGQFSSKAEETFILTWDDRIDINELEQLLKVREETPKLIPIELLVLSACQTAQGDDKAALGIAGIALKSGARSTIGTLWSVADESTALLIDRVYKQIALAKPNEVIAPQNKAQILRQAQLELIQSEQFNHPYYWAPFVLVGNWI
ncbi:CHAT domain-containing protein [Waterburya agarophytonicola K14]|uniref:CHAT domain-containing protein n=1 Tax=Waterburya agarophytonicola KI4 TaxID=2874699 RepID=A0A964BUW5_9CYAN|nr:CHAT domain-containing protein [Waterburya agarophytonicola]MCC0178295.1 CHAT domain-containing protein [Waterburya agarophytonicola KI4]